MNIRTRLNMSSFISLAMMLIMVPLLFWSFSEFRKANENDQLADKLQKTVSERFILREEYLLISKSPSTLVRWRSKNVTLGKLLDDVKQRFGDDDFQEIVNNLIKNNDDAIAIFNRIASNREQLNIVGREHHFNDELERRLMGQLLYKSYLISDASGQLGALNQIKVERFRDRTIALLVTLIAGLAATILSTSFILNKTLRRRISSLRASTESIAKGDLETRIQIIGNDELSDLSRTFNDMADKLKSSYESLQEEIEERKLTEESLTESEQNLRQNEERIEGLNRELQLQILKMQEANRELESFTYSVSHDLRAPLRHVLGFVEKLLKLEQGNLGEKSRHCLDVISSSASRMGTLIDDLLSFSRMGRAEMMQVKIDMNQLVIEVVNEIREGVPDNVGIGWRILQLPDIVADRSMLRQVLVNLISNAVKFSHKTGSPQIEIGCSQANETETVYYVKDNGAGFDMRYADKLFGLFQRLHSPEEFDGTGVGLANVRRVINRHGGRVWGEGKINDGAVFYFALPNSQIGGNQ